MSSGTAFRCKLPNREVLSLDRAYFFRPVKKPYRAPPNKRSKRKPRPSLLLTRLPLEILHIILLELDLPSIGRLRRVNTTGRAIVESLPAYFLLREHASDTLHLMHATQCSQYFSIGCLFAEFCQPRCRTCGDFGPFLYFPTATRSCFKCNYLRPQYKMALVSSLRFRFSLPPEKLRQLPVICSLGSRPQHRFADISGAKALAIGLHGSEEAIKQVYETKVMKREEEYQRRIQEWELRGENARRPRRPTIPSLGCYTDGNYRISLRLQATATFPYWDRKTRTLEPGVYCRACTYRVEEGKMDDLNPMGRPWEEYPARAEAYHRAFLEAEIPEHFLHCSAVKRDYDFRVREKKMYGGFRRKGTDFIVRPKNNIEA